MCILSKELKKKERKKAEYVSQRKAYQPKSEKIFIGKNDKRDPVPSYWKLT